MLIQLFQFKYEQNDGTPDQNNKINELISLHVGCIFKGNSINSFV